LIWFLYPKCRFIAGYGEEVFDLATSLVHASDKGFNGSLNRMYSNVISRLEDSAKIHDLDHCYDVSGSKRGFVVSSQIHRES